jgi:hypothetical protein
MATEKNNNKRKRNPQNLFRNGFHTQVSAVPDFSPQNVSSTEMDVAKLLRNQLRLSALAAAWRLEIKRESKDETRIIHQK